jgi:hypothetical protein
MRFGKIIAETLSLLMVLAIPVSSAIACGGEAPQNASSSCEDSRQASEMERLLSILVQKRLLSPNEAANVRAEVKKDEQESSSVSSAVQRSPVGPCRNQSVASAQKSESSPLEQRVQEVNAKLPFEIGGYGQVQWDTLPGSGSTFLIRRGRISVDGDIRRLASYKIQIEALNSPALLDAYLQLKPLRYANFTFGQFKVPFSEESQRSSSDLFTVERSQVVNSLVPGRDNGSQGRDVGADVGGSYNFAHSAGVDYAFGIFNGAGIDRKDDNNRKDFAARLSLHPFRGLALAGDYYNGAAGPTLLARDRQEGEVAYAQGPLTLLGEFIWGRDGATHKQGWYGLAAWRFSSPWEAVFRADGYDGDRSKADNTTTTYLGGFNWYFARGLKWQVNEGLQSQRSAVKNTFLSQLQFRF